MKRSIVITIVIVILATLAVALAGCGVEQAATAAVAPSVSAAPAAKAEPTASKETLRYMKKTMPKLEKMRRLWSAGNQDAAAKLWRSVKSIPVNTSVDDKLADAYLVYANNVRYWMMEDGSCNMKQLEVSQEKAMAAWRKYR